MEPGDGLRRPRGGGGEEGGGLAGFNSTKGNKPDIFQ